MPKLIKHTRKRAGRSHTRKMRGGVVEVENVNYNNIMNRFRNQEPKTKKRFLKKFKNFLKSKLGYGEPKPYQNTPNPAFTLGEPEETNNSIAENIYNKYNIDVFDNTQANIDKIQNILKTKVKQLKNKEQYHHEFEALTTLINKIKFQLSQQSMA
jgi:hypothetical protein